MRRVTALIGAGLVVTAVAEITVFVLLADVLGAPGTVLLVVGASVLGLALLRREGVRAWRRFRRAVADGQPPGVRVADGLVGLVGALLLVLPGLVTDVLGLLLLVPPGRGVATRGVRRLAEARLSSRLAGDVFGPRRVRVRRGRPSTGDAGTAADDHATPDAGLPGPVVEGEIVDPDQAR